MVLKSIITVLLLFVTLSGICQKFGDTYWNDATLDRARYITKLMIRQEPSNTDTSKYAKVNKWIRQVFGMYMMPTTRIDSVINLDPIYSKMKLNNKDSILHAFVRQINTP
jgi:hypothetical protein